MASIDCTTCSVNDIIARSLKLHSQLLSNLLRAHARVHAEFADESNNREVTRSEFDLADRLHVFANAIDLGDYTIPNDDDVRSEAFSCAAWLQDLHSIMQEEIAEREDARSGRSGRGRRSPNDGPARALAASNRAFLRRG